MSINFSYNTFYQEYTNMSSKMTNIQIDTNVKPPLYYYKNPPNGNQTFNIKQWPQEYIIIGGIQFFISTDANNRLYFTLPFFESGKFWDNHFHFGLRTLTDFTSKPRKQKTIVFFHYTSQNPTLNGKNQARNCYFEDMIPIVNVEDIICEQGSAKTIMGKAFAQEIDIVREILLRPFRGPVLTGGFPSITLYRGKNGAIYFLKGNKKKYLKIVTPILNTFEN